MFQTNQVTQSLNGQSGIIEIYYLMAVDGTVYHSEEEKFDAIGAALAPNFAAVHPESQTGHRAEGPDPGGDGRSLPAPPYRA